MGASRRGCEQARAHRLKGADASQQRAAVWVRSGNRRMRTWQLRLHYYLQSAINMHILVVGGLQVYKWTEIDFFVLTVFNEVVPGMPRRLHM